MLWCSTRRAPARPERTLLRCFDVLPGPQDGNPFVVLWFAAMFLLSAGFAWWIIFAGGASRVGELHLMELMGHYGRKRYSERSIKLLALAGVLSIPLWVYLAILTNTPLPT